MMADYGDGGMLGEIRAARQAVCEFGLVDWGRCKWVELLAKLGDGGASVSEVDVLRARVEVLEGVLGLIADEVMCMCCLGTGVRSGLMGSGVVCDECGGERVLPALDMWRAHQLAKGTLDALHDMGGEADGV